MTFDKHNDAEASSYEGESERASVLLLGASGTIGAATYQALLKRGYRVVCPLRSSANTVASRDSVIFDLSDPELFQEKVFCDKSFVAVVSCVASRSPNSKDAWAVDYSLNASVLEMARKQDVRTFVLLSAICVQKPRLQFQFAKLAFENQLIEAGITFSIVRPTAYFKSLSGQIRRVVEGKPYLLFGNGELTACKPISDMDLANYLIDCIEIKNLQNRILPIGGPGPAVTPLEQGQYLFSLLGMRPRFRHVPVLALNAVVTTLTMIGSISKRARSAAELARVAHYYGTESMLLFDHETQCYSADQTPAYGSDTLFDHYRRITEGEISNERVDTTIF